MQNLPFFDGIQCSGKQTGNQKAVSFCKDGRDSIFISYKRARVFDGIFFSRLCSVIQFHRERQWLSIRASIIIGPLILTNHNLFIPLLLWSKEESMLFQQQCCIKKSITFMKCMVIFLFFFFSVHYEMPLQPCCIYKRVLMNSYI